MRPAFVSSLIPNQKLPVSRRTALQSTVIAIPAWQTLCNKQSTAALAQGAAQGIPTTQLAPGLHISRVIKGCWQLSGGHRGDPNSSPDHTSGNQAVQDFQRFVDAGITTFDTADIYGPSEKLIGQYLASLNSPEARSRCQILTKFCCFGDSMRQARQRAFVEKGIYTSQRNLGVEVLDCVQFYWHDFSVPGYVDAALHLAELQASGKLRSIGVTNFDVPRLSEIVDAGVSIVSNQVQYSLLDTRPDNGMVSYCTQHGMQLLPYGTVAGGFLSKRYFGSSPQSVQVNTYSLSKYGSVIGQRGGWDWLQSLLRTLHGIGEAHGVGIAEVASRWVLHRPAVAGIIVGARNASHVEQHRRLFEFELTDGDLAAIDQVLSQGRPPTSDVYSWERGGGWA